MLRFGVVLLITALPLLGMEAMSTRRETTQQVFDSAAEALNAFRAGGTGKASFRPDSRRCTGVNAGAACANRHPQL